jgi:hypothetical protein
VSNLILIVWLLCDLIWGLVLIGGSVYLIVWKGRSAWWFIIAAVLSTTLGGDKLYKRLSERVKITPSPHCIPSAPPRSNPDRPL